MDGQTIASLISTLGFPIVACIGLGWYVKYQTDKNFETTKEMRQEHVEEMNKITEALNNNTIALQKLVVLLGKDDEINE